MASTPLSPAEMNELGRNVIATGDLDQASEIFELLFEAGIAEARGVLALGIALQAASRTQAALEWVGRAVLLEPDNPLTFHVLAHLLIEVEAFEAGADAARQALKLRTDFTAAMAQLGHCLQKLGRSDEAVCALERALDLAPENAAARLDLGNAYQVRGNWDLAEAAFARAALDDPASSKPFFNLGNLLQRTGRYLEAQAAYDRALAIAPDDAAARVNAGLLQLAMQDFHRGWANFEWRWKAPSERPVVRDCEAPVWRGDDDIRGKRILIQAEQGLGDTLQFIRYAKLLSHRGGEVIVDTPASLRSLLSKVEGVVGVISKPDDLPPVDYRCPMMGLPFALRYFEPLETSPNGYLNVDTAVRQKWSRRLRAAGCPLVGLAYAGNPRHSNDRNRSIDLDLVLNHLPRGPRYLVLQTELREGDGERFSRRDDVEWIGSDFVDFMDTAAVAMELERIVTVDTAIAHLAGALGRPTHLLLPFEPDWRWGLGGSTCRWYPTMTLHRQLQPGDWSEPLRATSAALRELLADG